MRDSKCTESDILLYVERLSCAIRSQCNSESGPSGEHTQGLQVQLLALG